jgi:DNA-binding response OmpR family regulator
MLSGLKIPIDYNAVNILLLDDEFDIVAVFTLALEGQGFHVVGFTEPLLALEHFQRNYEKYGLVISDLRMPVMNGYQFIKQGHKVKEIRPQVKVFFMSAFEVNRMELPFVDIDEFIQKPILLDDLIKRVCKHMNS